MSKEYEESSGSTTEQAADREAASYESSSFMESYAFIFGRRKTTVSCYWLLYVP